MVDFSGTVSSVIVGALSSNPNLHPPVYPMVRLDNVRLHEFIDNKFQDSPSYREYVQPVGEFPKPYLRKSKTQSEGPLVGILSKTIQEKASTATEKAKILYRTNVHPIHQVGISYVSQGIHLCVQGYYNVLDVHQRVKTHIFGPFRLVQNVFLSKLERKDYLGALQLAHGHAEEGLLRLIAYSQRREAIDNPEYYITKTDRISFTNGMDRFLAESEEALVYWWRRRLGLGVMYDLLYKLQDAYRVLEYRERTGGSKGQFITLYEKRVLDSLWLELQVSYHRESCDRPLNVVMGALEKILNMSGSQIASDCGAKQARPFPEVVAAAKAVLLKSEKDIKPYEEHEKFVEEEFEVLPTAHKTDKSEKYLEWISKDYFLMAEQIARNGHFTQDNQYPWEAELRRLESYKGLIMSLWRIEDEFFILKRELADRLKNKNDPVLRQKFSTIDEENYRIYEERICLKQTYQEELQKGIKALNPYWDQFKTSLKDRTTKYLLQGTFYDTAPSLEEVVSRVRERITIYCGYLRDINDLLGKPHGTGYKAQEDQEQKDGPIVIPTQEVMGLSQALLEVPASSQEIDRIAQQSYTRFYTPSEYYGFLMGPEFEEQQRIGVAINFCRDNCAEETPYWQWERERRELTEYRDYLRAISAKKDLRPDYVQELQLILRKGFRQKVLTDLNDFNAQKSNTVLEMTKNFVSSKVCSGVRKAVRLVEEGSLLNQTLSFRDPRFKVILTARLNPEGQVDLAPNQDVKRVFTLDDYNNFVASDEFEEAPSRIAEVILQCLSQGEEETAHWDFVREKSELKTFYDYLQRNNTRMDVSSQEIAATKKELIERFRKKVRMDYVACNYSQSTAYHDVTGTYLKAKMSSGGRSVQRLLRFESPWGQNITFRDEAFHEKMEELLKRRS